MANHPQAEKRNRQREKLQARNRHHKTTMRTHIKRVREAIGTKNAQAAQQALSQAVPVIDGCAQKGVIPKGRASRLVSRLTLAVNAVAVS